MLHAAGHGSADAAPFPRADRADDAVAPLSAAGRALHDRFVAAVDDDLDLPVALATVRDVLRSDVPDDEKRWLVLDADMILGLDLHRAWENAAATDRADLPAGAETLLSGRVAARAAGDYASADALRARLLALGIEPIDRAGGEPAWRSVTSDARSG